MTTGSVRGSVDRCVYAFTRFFALSSIENYIRDDPVSLLQARARVHSCIASGKRCLCSSL
jgi:hypothetical protein